MSENTTTPKKDIYSYLAVLLFLALFAAGVWGVVSSRIASNEYKNSDDVREVSAVPNCCIRLCTELPRLNS